MARRLFAILLGAAALSACAPTVYQVPVASQTGGGGAVQVSPPPSRSAGAGLADYNRIVGRVESVAEAFCREELPGRPPIHCDYDIRLITDPNAPPNAYQTLTREGRPVIGITRALLAQTGSADEIAFVLSHEAGHHIAGHIPRGQTQQILGALIFGGLAAVSGGGDQAVSDMMELGSSIGGRVYSQTYELEADVLGAFIAARAGFDPERGALMFTRPALQSGGGLLSTHPPSPQRLATVRSAAEEIRRQRAEGLTPRPGYARR